MCPHVYIKDQTVSKYMCEPIELQLQLKCLVLLVKEYIVYISIYILTYNIISQVYKSSTPKSIS